MFIITISTDRYTKGKEIAEKVAQKMGYECVSREIILSAAQKYGVPEMKLLKAIKDVHLDSGKTAPASGKVIPLIKRLLVQDLTVYFKTCL